MARSQARGCAEGVGNQSAQEYEICSLAEDQPAILIGRGWECIGFWRWAVSKPRHGSFVPNTRQAGVGGGAGLAAENCQARGCAEGVGIRSAQEKRIKLFIDTSRPKPEMIPGKDAPTHWAPLRPIPVARLMPSPAFAVDPDDIGITVDADWPFRYAPPGAIGIKEAEHRLLRALKASRTHGITREIRLGIKSNYPVHQIVGDRMDYAPPIEPREFSPTRRDLDDWDIALTWLIALYPPHQRPSDWKPGSLNGAQKTFVWRSWGYSWPSIAERLKKTPHQARKSYQASLEIVAAAANQRGQP